MANQGLYHWKYTRQSRLCIAADHSTPPPQRVFLLMCDGVQLVRLVCLPRVLSTPVSSNTPISCRYDAVQRWMQRHQSLFLPGSTLEINVDINLRHFLRDLFVSAEAAEILLKPHIDKAVGPADDSIRWNPTTQQ